MSDPSQLFSPAFWKSLQDKTMKEMQELVYITLLKGVENGTVRLPNKYRVFIDYDKVNDAVMAYARDYTYTYIRGITESTMKGTQKAIGKWVGSGQPISVLKDQLEKQFSPERADRIAVTEVTRVYAEGNREVWESTGIVNSMTWMTSEDELVCEICGELDGTNIGIGDVDGIPPAHVNCRCWLQPEVDLDSVESKIEDILNEH